MFEFISEYGLFLLKVITILAAVITVISFAAASKKGAKQEGLEVKNLNKKHKELSDGLQKAILAKDEWKAKLKSDKAKLKISSKRKKSRPRAYVIDFIGDLKASAVPSLREEVTAILDVAKKSDQVIVRLDNSGGVVHEHGLAASQLVRIRNKNINLVVIVDKVAASGGYLMAAVANKIYAAPFAILGSIGVIAQLPNFNRLLDSHGVDFEQVTAGQYKRNVTMFGKNTDEDREYRPAMNLSKVATGEHWYGRKALDLGLADEIKTSDELLIEMSKKYDIFSVKYKFKQPLKQRIMGGMDSLFGRFEDFRWRRKFESELPR